MTQELNSSAMCFCFTWENQLVAFAAILPQLSKGVGKAMRMSRLVILPDFQGLGLGGKILDFMGGICLANGYKFYIKTIHFRMGLHLEHSNKWKPTIYNGKLRKKKEEVNDIRCRRLFTRKSYCYKYNGNSVDGYESLMKPTRKMRYDKSMEGQLLLF